MIILKKIYLAAFCIMFLGQSFAGEYLVISSSSTSVSDQTEAVKRNISIAASKLNGYCIRSGAVFSFNDTVGEASSKNGYFQGNVLYRDKVVMETGGGVCQVSSTLYNALLNAGFAITERYRHFQPVTYVPFGLDATVKFGKKDLRMKNISNEDVYISAEVSDSSLTIKLSARSPLKYRYRMVTEETSVDLPFEDNDGVRPGLEVEVYRIKMSGEKEIEKALLYKDFYPPVRRN